MKLESTSNTSMDDQSLPRTSRTDALDRYHPGGDPRNPPKDAPSALHSVIVPNVNLPKVRKIILLLPGVNEWRRWTWWGWRGRIRDLGNEHMLYVGQQFWKKLTAQLQELHEKYNKWGKDGY